ncbi:Quinoprotein glucose dehydrogenase [Caballeronia temeraria]|uniref:Quinoprotein glucose dehydrogenase n=1 Tax=Caballeronia temeraria TaxID=1777137 RepID=A0A158AEX7_9BURK|nr:Quinoprotein glucose dehydrogenase [Caballeronia temeraria]
MTYEANGKQYGLIVAGDHGSFLTKLGDSVIAYALPDKHCPRLAPLPSRTGGT